MTVPRSSKKVWTKPVLRPISASPETIRHVAQFIDKMREDVAPKP